MNIIAVDVEMSGRQAQSMFAVSMRASFKNGTDDELVEYFPIVDQKYESVNTVQ